MLRNPQSFPKGTKLRLHDLENCGTCEVTLSQPLPQNETILVIYENIPSYDSWSGNKNVSVRDILSLFNLFNINKELWEDYYQRILFFHTEFINARQAISDKKAKREEAKIKMSTGSKKRTGKRK